MSYRAVMPFPVMPGKDARVIADHLKAHPDQYREDRGNAGVILERAYLQKTPMGDFVVAHWETQNDLGETIKAIGASRTEIGRWFVEQVREIHGADLTQPMAQLPELIAEWIDPQVSEIREGVAFCGPILPDRVDAMRAWGKKTYGSEALAASRRRHGFNKDIVMLTLSPQGPFAAVYIEGRDVHAADRSLLQSEDPFDVEFFESLKSIFPPSVDLKQPIDVTEIFDSTKLDGAQLTGKSRQASQTATSG
jgi:hypothetical protein